MCNICTRLFLALVLLLFFKSSAAKLDKETFRKLIPFRECLGQKFPGLCLKERAIDALNETIKSDEPLTILGVVEIGRNPDYHFDLPGDHLPLEASARSSKLSDVLYSMIEEYFKSRVIKFNMAPAFQEEARKKGGGGGGKGGGKGGMMILAMGGMAAMVAQMFMGKIAFMAGTALVLAKVALFMSAIVGLKKLASSGGGKETSHVVYASSDGHSHGGGGWHRSLNNDAHNIAYKAHINEATGY